MKFFSTAQCHFYKREPCNKCNLPDPTQGVIFLMMGEDSSMDIDLVEVTSDSEDNVEIEFLPSAVLVDIELGRNKF